jgi:carbon-monoxide dehydrogenase small subunit
VSPELQALVNGEPVRAEVPHNELLLDFLRDRLGLTGAKRSCDTQVCGACTVLVDGLPVSSCCYLAAETDGRRVETIEGFRQTDLYRRIEEAFLRHAATQCGFCTPGVVMTVAALLQNVAAGDEGYGAVGDEGSLRAGLGGNLCRCTGYRAITDAVVEVLRGVS